MFGFFRYFLGRKSFDLTGGNQVESTRYQAARRLATTLWANPQPRPGRAQNIKNLYQN